MGKPDDYFALNRVDMIPFIPKTVTKVIEFGCGEGNFVLRLAKDFGAEAWGVEIEEEPSRIAATRLHKVIQKDALASIDDLPENYFDVAVFNDVLEHLVDPQLVLSSLKSKIVPGGVVVASIPNVRFYRNFFDLVFKGNWNYEEFGILDRTHLRFFTKKSIRKLFEPAGYSIETIKGISRSRSFRPVLASILTLGAWSDIAFLQFAVVAKKQM